MFRLLNPCMCVHMPFRPRCSLSPSPATGLVGMQENTFLSDFFACVGFLPLVTKRYRTLSRFTGLCAVEFISNGK